MKLLTHTLLLPLPLLCGMPGHFAFLRLIALLICTAACFSFTRAFYCQMCAIVAKCRIFQNILYFCIEKAAAFSYHTTCNSTYN